MPNGPNTSWMYQGRQAHGWFGDGTSPDSADDESQESDHRVGGLFDPGNIGDRVDYAARCVIGSLSRADRRNPAAVFDSRALGKLRNAVIATDGASGLSRMRFGSGFSIRIRAMRLWTAGGAWRRTSSRRERRRNWVRLGRSWRTSCSRSGCIAGHGIFLISMTGLLVGKAKWSGTTGRSLPGYPALWHTKLRAGCRLCSIIRVTASRSGVRP